MAKDDAKNLQRVKDIELGNLVLKDAYYGKFVKEYLENTDKVPNEHEMQSILVSFATMTKYHDDGSFHDITKGLDKQPNTKVEEQITSTNAAVRKSLEEFDMTRDKSIISQFLGKMTGLNIGAENNIRIDKDGELKRETPIDYKKVLEQLPNKEDVAKLMDKANKANLPNNKEREKGTEIS